MAYAKRTARRKPTSARRGTGRAYTRGSTRSAATRKPRRTSSRKGGDRVVRIVIEQPSPNAAVRPFYAQQEVRPDRKPRFG